MVLFRRSEESQPPRETIDGQISSGKSLMSHVAGLHHRDPSAFLSENYLPNVNTSRRADPHRSRPSWRTPSDSRLYHAGSDALESAVLSSLVRVALQLVPAGSDYSCARRARSSIRIRRKRKRKSTSPTLTAAGRTAMEIKTAKNENAPASRSRRPRHDRPTGRLLSITPSDGLSGL